MVLDTHVWLRWIISAGADLPRAMVSAIRTADVTAVSGISCWEVSLLEQRNRIDLPLPACQWIQRALAPTGILCLPVSCEIGVRAAALTQHHKDPADRIIIATAIEHQAELLSLDGQFPAYAELAGRLIGA
ncbi:type II toxin-antitoxin system VapC family toxin [uncultured Thiodictyon sp.]|uniref:type II toxin-antitoxin system VapC family toxin n=1 Tax=uncultured Thiodictyon sp. TaxID=1846217 RepID=UPI0025D60ABF|nr:type II toxin-antitoxin system VapC family toxin [uncultured Thiodictyon sp.]